MSEPYIVSDLWIDRPDAEEVLASKTASNQAKDAIRSLIRVGIAVIRRAHPPELCSAVVADYQRYVETNRDYVMQNLDTLGREKRLVNFHLWSSAAAQIPTNPKVMEILDLLFDNETAVYTSLMFKYGTQQPVHRDTPHFATWPPKRFAGVWTALEPVRIEAGPLFYHAGAHRFTIDPQRFMNEAIQRLPNESVSEQLLMALDLYNGEVMRTAPTVSDAKMLELQIGDTVIWHPELPHGGSPASDPYLTRKSIVFHCSPVNVQVHQHDAFFSHMGPEAPPPRYGYREDNGRKFAVSGEVGFM
jgi:ectoine hydroxylase-related dioxygenase (phytanoyl-CoA dioxygenase family)